MDLSLITNWLDAFQTYRSISEKKLGQLLLRMLENEGVNFYPNPNPNPNPNLNIRSSKNLCSIIVSLIQSIKNLNNFNSLNQNKDQLIISLSSGRLGIDMLEIDIRSYLTKLLEGVQNHKNNEYQKLIQNCSLVLQDPINISNFRKFLINDNSDILVLDKICLLAILIQHPFKLILKLKETVKYYGLTNYKEIVFGALIELAYSLQNKKCSRKLKLIMLTSNSFTTEVIRLHAVCSPKYDLICEVQHGVPPIWEESYLKSVMKLGKNPIVFISQINDLENFGIFQYDDISINSFINKYKFSLGKDSKKIVREKIIYYEIEGDEYIITFAGTTEWVGQAKPSHLNSPIYLLEKSYILKIINTMKTKKILYKIFYSPHPLVDINLVKDDSFFKDNNILISENTVFNWLISDAFASMYSSTLFEASIFGIKVITPIKKSDMVYPDVFLDKINYQQEAESYSEVLDRVIKSESRELTVYERADYRADQLF